MFVALDRVLSLWRKWTFRSEHFNPPASRFVISKGSCSPSAFARLMSKLAEAGADRLYRSIDRWWPVARRQFRSIRRFSIAIQLVVHARSNENESARRALCTRCFCTRLVCRRFVSFRDRLFFFVFSFFERGKRQIFRVWERLQMFVVLSIVISGIFCV